MLINHRNLWILASISSVLVALASYRFLFLGLETAFNVMMFHIEPRRVAFLLHVIFGPAALFIGVFQFSTRLRKNRPWLHRWLGRAYAISITMSAGAALALVAGSWDRPIAATGFGLLAILWLVFAAMAIKCAMEGDFTMHRKWMIRSFALTFSAVTLRIQLPIFIGLFGMDYPEASNYLAWSCWVPNLIFIRWYFGKKVPSLS